MSFTGSDSKEKAATTLIVEGIEIHEEEYEDFKVRFY